MSRLARRTRLSPATPKEVEHRDPAASMALLLDAMHHPLDPLYEDVAHRRLAQKTDGEKPRRSLSEMVIIAVLTLVLGFLVGSAGAALKVPKKVAADARSQLADQVEAKQRANDKTTKSIKSLRRDISSSRGEALAGSSHGDLQSQIAKGEASAGLAAAEGSGLELHLANPSSDDADSADSDPRTGNDAQALTSRDLQRIVNGMWQAGATGIAINDQRLTSLSAIRFAGSAVLVNYRPLTTPYTVQALGPGSMTDAFRKTDGGRYLDTLRQHGFKADLSQEAHVELPAGVAAPLAHAKVTK